MLEVRLVCVGKLKERYLREAFVEYEKRLKPLCRLLVFELDEVRLPEATAPREIERALEQEGQAILDKCKGTVIPLCIEGRETDSPGFARILEQAMTYPGCVTLVIGSSFGLSPAVKAAGQGLSFSRMTFPHQLVRILLCEQLYRGFQILAGTKYHK